MNKPLAVEADEPCAPVPADAWRGAGEEFNARPHSGAHTSHDELSALTEAFLAKGGKVRECQAAESAYAFQRIVEAGKPWGRWEGRDQDDLSVSARRYKHIEGTILQLLGGDELPDIPRLIRASGGTRGQVTGILRTLIDAEPKALQVLMGAGQ